MPSPDRSTDVPSRSSRRAESATPGVDDRIGKKRAENARMRENRKKMKLASAVELPTAFRLPVDDFPPVPEASVQARAFEFARALDQAGVNVPRSKADVTRRLCEALGAGEKNTAAATKFETLGRLESAFAESRSSALQLSLVDSDAELGAVLEQPLKVALMRGGHDPDEPILSVGQMMDGFARRSEDPKVDVHDGLYEGDEINATSTVTLAYMREVFEQETEPTAFKNFLNIDNIATIPSVRAELQKYDLLLIIRTKQQSSKSAGSGFMGRTDKPAFVVRPKQEFEIATTSHCISGFHHDSGGCCTWILILQGRKDWCWVAGEPEEVLRSAVGGSYATDFADDIVGVGLQVGDVLFMGPGTLHAVYCARPTLMVGGFFYTAASYPVSVDFIRHQLDSEIQDNEDISITIWKENTEIMANAVACELFDERQTIRIRDSVRVLLESLTVRLAGGRGWNVQGTARSSSSPSQSPSTPSPPPASPARTSKRSSRIANRPESREAVDRGVQSAVQKSVAAWFANIDQKRFARDKSADWRRSMKDFVTAAAKWYVSVGGQ